MPNILIYDQLGKLPEGTELNLHATVLYSEDGTVYLQLHTPGGTATAPVVTIASDTPVEDPVPPPKPDSTCIHGCGEPTAAGSRFVAGHDTKLQSTLWRQVRAGGQIAVEAAVELALLGWTTSGPSVWGEGRMLTNGGANVERFLARRAAQRTHDEDTHQPLLGG